MARGTSVPDRRTAATPSSSLKAALQLARSALARRPAALITDIDGTISRIVPRPEDATVEAPIARALEALAGVLDLVAVITARDEATARRMVGANKLTYVGNYGLLPGSRVDATDAILKARAEVAQRIEALPCVTIEDKGVSFSLHYRNCDDPKAARLRLLEIVRPIAALHGARILEGKRVIELVPAGLPDKRSAFLKIVGPADVKGLVYLGDDISDVPVFREVARLRDSRRTSAIGVAVTDEETDASVREAADVCIDGVEAAASLLQELAVTLEGRPA